MATKQSEANKNLWETLAGKGELSPEVIGWFEDQWTTLATESGGVDYIEVDADGLRAMWIVPKQCAEERVIFYVHGGGFTSGSIYTHRKMVAHLAKAAGCRALTFDYDYAHQNRHPRQLDQTLTAYRWLLGQRTKPKHIAFAGDSSGGTLVFGALQRIRDEHLPTPAAVMTISAWVDMDLTGASYESNREKDIFFTKEGGDWLVTNFLGENGDRRDPYASPLYADMTGFPPVYLQAGADETLVDENRMFAERAEKAGVDVKLDVFPEMLHSFQMMAGRAPEADEAIRKLADWVRPKLALR